MHEKWLYESIETLNRKINYLTRAVCDILRILEGPEIAGHLKQTGGSKMATNNTILAGNTGVFQPTWTDLTTNQPITPGDPRLVGATLTPTVSDPNCAASMDSSGNVDVAVPAGTAEEAITINVSAVLPNGGGSGVSQTVQFTPLVVNVLTTSDVIGGTLTQIS